MMSTSIAIAAGSLRHGITIEHQVSAFDRSGSVTAWTPFLETRAAIESVRAGDAVTAGQTTAQIWFIVTIRYRPGINAAMRIRGANAIYRIQAIENVLERNRVLKMTCLQIGQGE